MSSPTPEQWTAMQKLVQTFFQKPDAEPFRVPVAWKEMGLYDYPQIIKKPMDLGTVKKNIVDRKYKTLDEANADVRLVWSNCMTYNADGSDFYILAQGLNKKWNEKYKKLLEDLGVTGAGDPIPPGGLVSSSSMMDSAASSNKLTLDEKRSFAKSLYKISKEELGMVLVTIEKKCPSALLRNEAEDELELNVDELPAGLFMELQQYIKNCGGGGGGGGTGKAKKKSSAGSAGGSAKRQKA